MLIYERRAGTNKVVYKPDSQSTDEFMVIIEDAAALKKWKAGETSIPLTEIVDSFDVLHSGQGSQGILGRPSNQELDSVFGTHNQDEVVEMILKKGALQGGDAPEKTASKNDSQGGGFSVSKGSHSGSGHGGR
ncbi:uncharacterized protein L969DRAFT_87578 [Mixia osmundae IAM 14324]|uniref:uncharacterized protein n=1 Tax=Mixia osmundae (strain CBS 9802 / IAM 14324 / JCM 22182 / KY 12970) TaxID=764103 RepID=UPI0004A54A02|nr:uncharacterized protein L969DRAFT_87578 [Mixia osmundae IAM 14324]KEI39620.1 hypothetical protein L969DRAFT_87578 [Mixia osmundae IAM 14324]